MGILGLSKLLADFAPSAIKDNNIKSYFGRKVAIDASMSIYQFLIAVRSDGAQLTDAEGETTSHLNGLFYRTIRILESGIKPVYVFDGKPPEMKSEELAKRAERRSEAEKSLEVAEEKGDQEGVEKFQRRIVKVTKHHNDECKRLLSLMGVPYVEAPCEAEAQCAALVKADLVYATATEDMDSLTYGSNVVLRHLTASEAKKLPIREIKLDRVLSELEIDQKQFIDMCILLGCDYCESCKGLGPKRAVSAIQNYKHIEGIIQHKDKIPGKITIPDNWQYEEARKLFSEPEVLDSKDIALKWQPPDEEGLVKFMVEEKSFNEDRIRNGVKRILKSRQGARNK